MEDLTARFTAPEELPHLPTPKPGHDMWPEWFKKLNRRVQEESTEFADAMSAGYMLRLAAAVRVDQNNETGELNFNWRTGETTVAVVEAAHSPLQVAGSGISHPFKWINYFALKLPEGWSALYTHPLNRHELPFRTLTGLVDDPYHSPVNFPFEWIGTDAETFLDAGTPIAQVIPFQRVNWQAEIKHVPRKDVLKDAHSAVTHLQGYRRLYRRPKWYR